MNGLAGPFAAEPPGPLPAADVRRRAAGSPGGRCLAASLGLSVGRPAIELCSAGGYSSMLPRRRGQQQRLGHVVHALWPSAVQNERARPRSGGTTKSGGPPSAVIRRAGYSRAGRTCARPRTGARARGSGGWCGSCTTPLPGPSGCGRSRAGALCRGPRRSHRRVSELLGSRPDTPGWSRKYAPTSLLYHGQSYSVVRGEWMPDVPAPGPDEALERRLLRPLSTSPVVHRKITTSYFARLWSVNAAASSVASTFEALPQCHLRDRDGALRNALRVSEGGGLREDQRTGTGERPFTRPWPPRAWTAVHLKRFSAASHLLLGFWRSRREDRRQRDSHDGCRQTPA